MKNSHKKFKPNLISLLILSSLSLMISCGGGGGDDSSSNWTPPDNYTEIEQTAFKFSYNGDLWDLETTIVPNTGDDVDAPVENSYFYDFIPKNGTETAFVMKIGSDSIDEKESDDGEVVTIIATDDETYETELPSKLEIETTALRLVSEYEIPITDIPNKVNFIALYIVQEEYGKNPKFDIIREIDYDKPFKTNYNKKAYDFTMDCLDLQNFTHANWRFVLFNSPSEEWKTFLIIISSNEETDTTQVNEILKTFKVK